MSFDQNRPLYVGLALLIAAFLISLIWMLIVTHDRAERILFFPGHINPRLHGEARIVPRHGDLERDVDEVVKELFLGPADLSMGRVVPQEAEVRALMVRGRTVYIDLEPRIMFLQDQLNLSLEEAFEAIGQTIQYNFRGVRNVVITVNGQLPGQPHFEVRLRLPVPTAHGNESYALTNGISSI